jgi:hypothetical protein
VVHGTEEPDRPLTLEKAAPVAWIDRVLPSRPHLFLAVVFGISVACWLLGLLLAADRTKFLQTREWYAQLIYLPVHFITLRLFVTVYTRNFLAGAAHLTVPFRDAVRRMLWVLGPVGLLSVLIAAPLCYRDLGELEGDKYREDLVGPVEATPGRANAEPDAESLKEAEFFLWSEAARPDAEADELVESQRKEPPHTVCAADALMWGIWCVEWVINAYIWVLLLGFLYITMHILRKYHFRDPVEIVLHEKQYRPFLLMSGQGASIILGFAVANALYVLFTYGSLTDYIGMGVTIVLLLVGFGPPWLQIKAHVEDAVNREIFSLRDGVIAAHLRDEKLDLRGATALPDLASRVNEALLMLRIDYLDRLSRQLGRYEGTMLLLKLLAPAATIGWRFIRIWIGVP